MCDTCEVNHEPGLINGRYYYIIMGEGQEPRLSTFVINNEARQFRINENFYIDEKDVIEGVLIPSYEELISMGDIK